MTLGQQTILALCNEMDVKGTTSGKSQIFHPDGRPCDLLGYMLVRLGYTNASMNRYGAISPNGKYIDPYHAASKELGISVLDLYYIWSHIDTVESTNESIRQTIRTVCKIKEQ